MTGFLIGDPYARRGEGGKREGLSATVCDTAYAWRTIQTYRSEDPTRVPTGRFATLGVEGALAAARDHARYLNRLHWDD